MSTLSEPRRPAPNTAPILTRSVFLLSIFLTVSCAAPESAVPPPEPRIETRAYAIRGANTYYPGHDITYWNGPFGGCAAACDATPGCVAFVLHKDNGANCWLKSGLQAPLPNPQRDTFQLAPAPSK